MCAVTYNKHFALYQVQVVFIKSCFQSTNNNELQDFVVHGHMLERSVHK